MEGLASKDDGECIQGLVMRGVSSEGGGVYHQSHLPLIFLLGEGHRFGPPNVCSEEIVET